jgi:Tol biopolymer transport system component
MKLQHRRLLRMTTACLALFFGFSTMVESLAAQEVKAGETSSAVNNGFDNDHDRGPRNGDLAVSAVTVVDGAYGINQIATLPDTGGPYHFLSNLPDGGFDPTFDRDGDTIFFWGPVPNGPDGIYTVPSSGGRVRHLRTDCTTNPNCLGEGNPAISPDGLELLEARALGPIDQNGCVAFAGIYLLRIDGSHPRQLSATGPACTGDSEPGWSPDGSQVLFQHQDLTGLSSLVIARRDGSHVRQVTPAGMDIGNPDWSPDGERIVFQSPAEPADDQHPQQVYTIHPDGTHLRQITHYAPITGVVIGTNGTRWSPDGRKIVFAHRDPNTTIGPDGQPHADLFEMNPDGSDVVQITFSPEKDNNPAWGPRR